MTYLSRDQIKKLNKNRLKSYLKRLRIENQHILCNWYCEVCREYHIPNIEEASSYDKKLLNELSELIKLKRFIKDYLKSLY